MSENICKECGEQIERFPEIRPGLYCRDFCYACYTKLTANKAQQDKKHEEIKRMAWEMFLTAQAKEGAIRGAWMYAEEFYDFAKAKQGEK